MPRRSRKDIVGKQVENDALAARERQIRELIKRLRAEQRRIRRARRSINDDITE